MNRLRELTRTILDPHTGAGALRSHVLELASMLEAAQSCVIRVREGIGDGETRTPAGLAISPAMAILCADDYMRTARFLRGVHDAIADARAAIRERPVRVLYVGCGPFAILAVPLMTKFSPQEARFTLVDIHERSINAAKEVVHSLGYDRSVTSFEVGDAALYDVKKDAEPDVIVMEIMQAALNAEPQVAITRHLLAQAPDALLVPEEVRIELKLVNLAHEFALESGGDGMRPPQRDRVPVATLFTLNRAAVRGWAGCAGDRLPAAQMRVPDMTSPNHQLMMFTYIHIYGEHSLQDYESGLTCPRCFAFDESVRPGDVVQFHYALGCSPGVVLNPDRPDRISG